MDGGRSRSLHAGGARRPPRGRRRRRGARPVRAPAQFRDCRASRRARCRPRQDEPAGRSCHDLRRGAVGARPGRRGCTAWDRRRARRPPRVGRVRPRRRRGRFRRWGSGAGLSPSAADPPHGFCRQALRCGRGCDGHCEPQPCGRQRVQGLHGRRRPGDTAGRRLHRRGRDHRDGRCRRLAGDLDGCAAGARRPSTASPSTRWSFSALTGARRSVCWTRRARGGSGSCTRPCTALEVRSFRSSWNRPVSGRCRS